MNKVLLVLGQRTDAHHEDYTLSENYQSVSKALKNKLSNNVQVYIQ